MSHSCQKLHRTISFLAAGGRRIASSRIRVLGVQKELASRGIDPRLSFCADADCLFIQKRIDNDVLEMARLFKNQRKLVVYDFDDAGAALEFWAPRYLLNNLLQCVNVVTTNTPGYINWIKEFYEGPIELLPDTIDYGLENLIKLEVKQSDQIRVLWFGNSKNFRLLEKYIPDICSAPNIKLFVCTGLGANFNQDGFNFIPWSYKRFPRLLRSCDVTLLTHEGGSEDLMKSNNRMITSIAWGVPSVVSATPEYSRTAMLIGQKNSLFHDSKTLLSALEALRDSDARKGYLKRAQPIIWSMHSPSVVADRICSILDNYWDIAKLG